MRTSFLIALGSNQRHPRHGAPPRVLEAALASLGVQIIARSKTIASAPLGPSQRNYANTAAIIETAMTPPELLDHLKTIEAAFGRRSSGQRWRTRVLDLDIILWSTGSWFSSELSIPHPEFRGRTFVLGPTSEIAPHWCDPLTNLSLRHLKARLDRKRPCA